MHSLRSLSLLALPLLLAACGDKDDSGEPPTDDTGPATVDADGDGYSDAEDCDDTDPEVNPGAQERCNGVDDDCDDSIDEDDAVDAATWFMDQDGDGQGDAALSVTACVQPDNYVADPGDCNDYVDSIYLGAPEYCDELDNDCDSITDEDDAVDAPSWYADTDGDGYGDPASSPVTQCEQPSGQVEDATDCDDSDEDIHPGADEYCDGVDSDCDGITDEDDAIDATLWYQDADADGFGDPDAGTFACTQPSGFGADSSDCDDSDEDIHPGADEYCDGVDSDCDGTTDEDDAIGAPTWYADGDGDGFGDATSATAACTLPAGHSADATDCDDDDPDTHPGADEWCDGYDTDCDGTTDENDAIDAPTWYADTDGDGFGDAGSTTAACTRPSGYVADDQDCDDADPDTHPGADEWCDGADTDCDGVLDENDAVDAPSWYADVDGDGWGSSSTSVVACSSPPSFVSDSGDCDDGDPGIHPGADEYCDGVDTDCDGAADTGAIDGSTFFADADADGYGDAGSTTVECALPSGYSVDSSDCDDANPDSYPGADEHCDGDDNDCDGAVDEDAVDQAAWYADSDGDGYGDASVTTTACSAPSGYVADDQDCDDADPTRALVCSACATLLPYPGSVTLTGFGASSAAASFCASYNAIDGDLEVVSSDLSDFVNLGCLCEVGGDLSIASNSVLASLTGLENLELVGGSLSLDDNDALPDLAGLDGLMEVGGDLTLLDSNALLVDFTGLEALEAVGGSLDHQGYLDLAGLDGLTSVGGDLGVLLASSPDYGTLSRLDSVGGSLDLSDAPSFSGLEALTSVGGDLVVTDMTATSFAGLDQLESIGGDLYIYDAAISDLSGLGSLHTVGGKLWVSTSASFTSLEGTALTSLGQLVLTDLDLVDLRGLEGLTTLGDFSDWYGSLGSFAGLEALTTIDDDLDLYSVDGLTDLTGLDQLTTIGDQLWILNCDDLSSLDGLLSIDMVGGDLYLEQNDLLGDYSGLETLREIGGNLDAISGTKAGLEGLETIGGYLLASGELGAFVSLESVGGALQLSYISTAAPFPALQTVGGGVYIEYSYASELGGFDSLGSIGGDLWIEDLPYAASDISGFPSLTSIGGDLWLEYNLNPSITGLGSLDTVGGDLKILYCSSLSSITGMGSLRAITGDLSLYANTSLTDVSGLMNIDTVGGVFHLQSNGLSTAQAEALRDAIGVSDIGGGVYIYE